MADKVEITDEMRARIGVDSPPWIYEVTTTSVRAFARGVGYTDPVYYDFEAARQAGYPSLPAPPTYLGTPVFIPGVSSDTFSGPAFARANLEHGLKFGVDGGTDIEYYGNIFAGDVLTVVSRLTDLSVRESKSVGQMLITSMETIYTNQDGRIVAIQKSQGIAY